MSSTQLITVEALERDGTPDGQWELINGELVQMCPTGEDHGAYVGAIAYYLGSFAIPRRLGRILIAEAGFVISDDPPVVRTPDVAFIRYDHLPAGRDRKRFIRSAADLVVEVIFTSDQPSDVMAQAIMWRESGVALVWVVDPDQETVTVFESNKEPRVVAGEEILDGGDALPGFSLCVQDIFFV